MLRCSYQLKVCPKQFVVRNICPLVTTSVRRQHVCTVHDVCALRILVRQAKTSTIFHSRSIYLDPRHTWSAMATGHTNLCFASFILSSIACRIITNYTSVYSYRRLLWWSWSIVWTIVYAWLLCSFYRSLCFSNSIPSTSYSR